MTDPTIQQPQPLYRLPEFHTIASQLPPAHELYPSQPITPALSSHSVTPLHHQHLPPPPVQHLPLVQTMPPAPGLPSMSFMNGLPLPVPSSSTPPPPAVHQTDRGLPMPWGSYAPPLQPLQQPPKLNVPLQGISKKRNRPKEKLSRRKHKNSHFGCSTCKSRRIKCDETFPRCKKCQKSSKECGYELLSPDELEKLRYAVERASALDQRDTPSPVSNYPSNGLAAVQAAAVAVASQTSPKEIHSDDDSVTRILAQHYTSRELDYITKSPQLNNMMILMNQICSSSTRDQTYTYLCHSFNVQLRMMLQSMEFFKLMTLPNDQRMVTNLHENFLDTFDNLRLLLPMLFHGECTYEDFKQVLETYIAVVKTYLTLFSAQEMDLPLFKNMKYVALSTIMPQVALPFVLPENNTLRDVYTVMRLWYNGSETSNLSAQQYLLSKYPEAKYVFQCGFGCQADQHWEEAHAGIHLWPTFMEMNNTTLQQSLDKLSEIIN